MRAMSFVVGLVMAASFGGAAAAAGAGTAREDAEMMPEDEFSWVTYTYEDRVGLDLETGGSGEVTLQEVDLLVLPIYMRKPGWEASVGFGFRWNGLDFSDTDVEDMDLYTVTLPLDVVHTVERWTLWAELSPGLHSDFEHLTGDDYRTAGMGLAMYAIRTNVQVGLGLAYDSYFGEDNFYPLGGVDWRPKDDLRLNLVFPRPRITWAPVHGVLVFADTQPAGDVWNVRDADSGGEYDLKIEGLRSAVGVEYLVAPHTWLQVAAGAAYDRHYEVRRNGNKVVDSDADDTWFVRAGLMLR